MRRSRSYLALLRSAGLLCAVGTSALVGAPAFAQDTAQAAAAPAADATERAKEWFKAGAAAYAAGDYLAAIQALDAAHAITPLPAIAFSIAQAERRQYFVSRQREHLARSVELFRRYIEAVPSGGRRSDAIDALSQLEPLLAKAQPSAAAPPVALPERATRIMVISEVPGARISVDGIEPGPSPLIREVTPGKHRVQVNAPGYREGQREITAVPGELVPITVPLAELPARLILSAPSAADVYVDGVLVSQGAGHLELELPSGRHRVSVAEKGHRVQTRSLLLERGATESAQFTLEPTSQRMASRVLFVGGAAALLGGAALTVLAVRAESNAQDFLDRLERRNASPAELVRYQADVATRNRYRWLANAGFASSLGMLITGLFLHELDTPGMDELYRSSPPSDGSLGARLDQEHGPGWDVSALWDGSQIGARLSTEF